MCAVVNHIDSLCEKVGKRWESIDLARKDALTEIDRIATRLTIPKHLVPSDSSFVVFGSLARSEWTVGSDIDWTLLIDGQADPDHLKVAQAIKSRFIEAGWNPPGPTETFGNLAFSHDIIHQIGGGSDTNKNTTQRILLLLESRAIGDSDAYERVVRNILNRYLDNDIGFLSRSGQQYKVPRFLLNDIVRYWRTICVDYATKHRERQGEKWALRNAKLRLSRKLIFASGLLMCFNCYLKSPAEFNINLFNQPEPLQPLLVHLLNYTRLTPLEIVAEALCTFATVETGRQVFDAYDRFLAIINDPTARKHLGELQAKDTESDKIFMEIRQISAQFQAGLNRLFFDDNPKIAELTKKYGMF